MRKNSVILFLLIILLITGGCADNTPGNMREGIYKLGMEVLSVVDDFLDEKISLREAHTEIDNLSGKINDFNEFTGTERLVQVHTSGIGINLDIMQSDDGVEMISLISNEDILEQRNRLAEILEEPVRKN